MFSLIVLSIFASFFIAWQRLKWEESYKEIEMAVDYRRIYESAILEDYDLENLLLELKARGVGAFAMAPEELAPETTAKLKDLGFEIVLVIDEFGPTITITSTARWQRFLGELSRLAPAKIVFAGAEIPGYEDEEHQETMLAFLKASQITVGLMEFARLAGIDYIYNWGYRRFIRAHTINEEELKNMSMTEAIARFWRAAAERNIRLFYIKPFNRSIAYNLRYLEELKSRLLRAGFELGKAQVPKDFSVNRWVMLTLFAGVVSLGILSLNKIVYRCTRVHIHTFAFSALLWLSCLVLALVGLYFNANLTRQVFALLTAILVPLSAFLLLIPSFEPNREASFKRGLQGVFSFSTIATLGGLVIGAILSGSEFFFKQEEFRGVKLALVLPLFLAFLIYFYQRGLPELQRFLNKQIKLGELILLSLGALALLIILLRSGNSSFIPVPAAEERLRGILEFIFLARPRFKEFLFGHPLLFLWSALGDAKFRGYGIIVLVLGMIGQVSIINTFAHLHTPLLLSLLRTINGLVLGIIVGAVLLALFKWGEKYWHMQVQVEKP